MPIGPCGPIGPCLPGGPSGPGLPGGPGLPRVPGLPRRPLLPFGPARQRASSFAHMVWQQIKLLLDQQFNFRGCLDRFLL